MSTLIRSLLLSVALVLSYGANAVSVQNSFGYELGSDVEVIAESELLMVYGGWPPGDEDDGDPGDDDPYEPPRQFLYYDWEPVYGGRLVSYRKFNETPRVTFSNQYGVVEKEYETFINDECQRRWTSGGVGIGTAFNVSIGTTYHCDINVRVAGWMQPGWGVRVWTATEEWVYESKAQEVAVYNTGPEPTGGIDIGRERKTSLYISPVDFKF